MCMCWFTYAYCFFLRRAIKKNNNNNKGICAPKSKLANISLFKEFVGGIPF